MWGTFKYTTYMYISKLYVNAIYAVFIRYIVLFKYTQILIIRKKNLYYTIKSINNKLYQDIQSSGPGLLSKIGFSLLKSWLQIGVQGSYSASWDLLWQKRFSYQTSTFCNDRHMHHQINLLVTSCYV